MAKNTQTVSFANFNCRFGSKFALLDLWDEIVWPAFLKAEPRVTKSHGTFYLLNVELVRTKEDAFVTGRFVRDATLSRELVLDNGVLRPSRAELEAAFVARFMLRLSTHTLVWVAETKQAPSISSFHATISKSLGHQWKQFIERLLWEEHPNHKRTERGQLRAELGKRYPMPILDIVAYPSEQSVASFLSTMKVLNEVTYRVVDPNPHYVGAQTGEVILGMKQYLAAKRASVRLSDPEGLDQESAAQQIADLNSSGVIEAQVRGVGPNGEKITGNSETMQVKVQVPPVPADALEAMKIMNGALEEQEKAGVLKVGKITEHARKIIARIFQTYFAPQSQ